MKGKILVVDDEMDIVSFIKDSLEDDGYNVDTAFDGDRAIKMANRDYDVILLDVMMPNIDGFDVCRRIRDEISCPIIFLSARGNEEDRVRGLALGGDDYIVKPFSIKELKARIKAHLRRDMRLSNEKKSKISCGDVVIDIKGYTVYFKNNLIAFAAKEFEIIELLAMHKGQVFSKEQIYEKVWGYDAEGDSSTVTEHIKKIRAKFSEVGRKYDENINYISTVWGVGYKWEKLK